MDIATPDDLFTVAIERYKAGEPIAELIPLFKEICQRFPKTSAPWTCLAWLYLLSDQGNLALESAKKALKFNSQDPQARVNLALALLETQQKGVRSHVEILQHLITTSSEVRDEIETSIDDGLTRKPEWKALLKMKQWLFS